MTGELGHSKIPDEAPEAPTVDVDFRSLEEIEPIGSGGNADVVKMSVPDAREVIAVKQPRLQGTLTTDAVEEFTGEAETWAKLADHDHVVGVLDWGSSPMPWIALEYMDGGTLADRIGDHSLEEGLWVGVCAARAVRHAHRRGVAHLDLKPENVLFRDTGRGLWDVPKVSDWGLAKMLLDHSESVEGLSPTYAAPEQFDPDTYGAPDDFTDVYQLGAILFEVLTGDPPFDGPATTVMNSHLNEAVDPPSDLDRSLPPAVDDVLLTALEKDKADRYESILDFRRDLEATFEHVVEGTDPSLIAERGSGAGAGRSGSATGRRGASGGTRDRSGKTRNRSGGTRSGGSPDRSGGAAASDGESGPGGTAWAERDEGGAASGGAASGFNIPGSDGEASASTTEEARRGPSTDTVEEIGRETDRGPSRTDSTGRRERSTETGADAGTSTTRDRAEAESVGGGSAAAPVDDTWYRMFKWSFGVFVVGLLLGSVAGELGILALLVAGGMYVYGLWKDLSVIREDPTVEWTPTPMLYLAGVFVWYVTIPLYIYRRNLYVT